jgi:hypothetical protein
MHLYKKTHVCHPAIPQIGMKEWSQTEYVPAFENDPDVLYRAEWDNRLKCAVFVEVEKQ